MGVRPREHTLSGFGILGVCAFPNLILVHELRL